MIARVRSAAGLALLLVWTVAAPVAAQGSGPRNLPPARFAGEQFVDARGCLFIRAGTPGRPAWVPRITATRKPMCGLPPTFGATAAPSKARVEAPPPRVGAPPPSVRVDAPSPPSPPSRRDAACPDRAPYGARVTKANGRRSLLCSSDPGFDADAALAQVEARADAPQAGAPAASPTRRATVAVPSASATATSCPADAPFPTRYAVRGGGSILLCSDAASGPSGTVARPARDAAAPSGPVPRVARPTVARRTEAEPAIPKGYVKAWKDGRLNPDRGRGTAAGQAQQDQIWTRDALQRAIR